MPIDIAALPETSPLVTTELEAQLAPLLARIERPLTLVSILGTGEKDAEMGGFLRHFARLCPLLSLRLLSPGEDPDADAALDAGLLPATGFSVEPERFCRFAFHGIPGGKEITGFVSALLTAAGVAKPLDKPTLKDISRIKTPARLQICVSLGCHHCAQMVIHAQQIAAENPIVTAHMIDANLYPELVTKYGIERVPVLLCDGAQLAAGGMTMAELCGLLKKR